MQTLIGEASHKWTLDPNMEDEEEEVNKIEIRIEITGEAEEVVTTTIKKEITLIKKLSSCEMANTSNTTQATGSLTKNLTK